MAKQTMREIRAKTRQMLDDPKSKMDQTQLAITIKLGQPSMSRFLAAPDEKIPSIKGDALLRLLHEVEAWEHSRVAGDIEALEAATDNGGGDYDHWSLLAAQLDELIVDIKNPEITAERKYARCENTFGLFLQMSRKIRTMYAVENTE